MNTIALDFCNDLIAEEEIGAPIKFHNETPEQKENRKALENMVSNINGTIFPCQ